MDGDYDPAKTRLVPLHDLVDPKFTAYAGETGLYLQACCGTERLVVKRANVLVKAAGELLTIHDFLSVVHPYLMARRKDIVAAMQEEQYRLLPVPAETELFMSLSHSNPDFLHVSGDSEWLQVHAKPRRDIVHDAATAERMKLYEPVFRHQRLLVAQQMAERRAAEQRAAGLLDPEQGATEQGAAERHRSNATATDHFSYTSVSIRIE